MKKKISQKVEKIQKNTELVSIMASQMLEMKAGERTRITPFAKSIILSNGSHPHFDSVERKLTEAMLWKDVTNIFNFYMKDGRLEEIERMKEDDDVNSTKRILDELQLIKKKLINFERENKKINYKLKKLEKR
jgi:hypothetical protein